ncbi:hypothetical protein ACIGBL_23755 [Streptomyces sp. NPDC085614]|uniref:hypothetical protein n=1 Tax=Streptomyces sp. NPDC085614 TaxID=3365733 RepID=UPI0037D2A5D4
MIVMQPVLEVSATAGFDLWPVARIEAYGHMPLSGALAPDEVGLAVMRVAACNDVDPAPDEDRPPRPGDPLASFLHGLLTLEQPFAAGGLRVTDTAGGATLLPGCCTGLEDWREWYDVLDGGGAGWFGHDPSPGAELRGETVRLTVDADRDGSPVILLAADELRTLLAGVERDLLAFHTAADAWASRYLPDQAPLVRAALARALALPVP